MKVRVILGNFKPHRDIVQGMAYSLLMGTTVFHILGVSLDQYDDVTPEWSSHRLPNHPQQERPPLSH
jgi:hypothetical protein